ncbi:MAG: DUF3429 domain-containing protein [Alphaproteobacteria bacterium]|nr:DUF3429 domain-containing protein [Alphaproteobacteria bacterium]
MSAVPHSMPRLAVALGIAGLIPFLAGTLVVWLPMSAGYATTGLQLVTIYGAIILSFLGGVRWGTAIGPYDGHRQGMEFGLSVLAPLAGVLAVVLPFEAGLTLLIGGFLLQALWDVTSSEAGQLPLWFGRLRMSLTIVVILTLIADLFAVVI